MLENDADVRKLSENIVNGKVYIPRDREERSTFFWNDEKMSRRILPNLILMFIFGLMLYWGTIDHSFFEFSVYVIGIPLIGYICMKSEHENVVIW